MPSPQLKVMPNNASAVPFISHHLPPSSVPPFHSQDAFSITSQGAASAAGFSEQEDPSVCADGVHQDDSKNSNAKSPPKTPFADGTDVNHISPWNRLKNKLCPKMGYFISINGLFFGSYARCNLFMRSLREKESAIIRSSFEDDAGATTTSESAAVREGALPSSGVTTSERTTVGEEPASSSTGAASEYSNEDSTTHTETVEPNTSARHYQNRIDDFSLERVNRLLEAEVSNNLLPRIFSAPIPAL